MDDMLVKSKLVADHITHLVEMFKVLRKYQLKLNPLKCAFGVALEKFLVFMGNGWGIEANPEKIQAQLKMTSSRSPHEIQHLTGRITALNWFISSSTDRCLLLFNALQQAKRIELTSECEEAFQNLKEHLRKPPLFFKLVAYEPLYIYQAMS